MALTWAAAALIGAAIGGTIGYVIANSVPPREEDDRRVREFTDEKWDDETDRARERRHRTGSDDGSFEDPERGR